VPKFRFTATERKTNGMCNIVFSDRTECWARETLEGIFGVADPGTYEVTVERVAPRAARIQQCPGNHLCGQCGAEGQGTTDVCQKCRISLGDTVVLSQLRIGGDGKPLVTGEE